MSAGLQQMRGCLRAWPRRPPYSSSLLTRGLAVIHKHSNDAIVSLRVGDHLELQRCFTQEDGLTFASVSGDDNPIHAPFSSSSSPLPSSLPLSEPIVPGMLTAALFSALFGSQLPGSVYVSQSLRFLRPVRYGETLHARIEVKKITERPQRRPQQQHSQSQSPPPHQQQEAGVMRAMLECDTSIHNAEGAVVVSGEAQVLVHRLRVEK